MTRPAKRTVKPGFVKSPDKEGTGHPQRPASSVLRTFDNPHPDRTYRVRLTNREFTSLSSITGKQSTSEIIIDYAPEKLCIESDSLGNYLSSFSSVCSFEDEIANRILQDIVTVCSPRRAIVTGTFEPARGITVPVSASFPPGDGRVIPGEDMWGTP